MGFVNNASNKVSSALGTDSSDSGIGALGKEVFSNPLVSGAATIAGGVLGGPGGAALVNGIASRSQGHAWDQVLANAAGAGAGAYALGGLADLGGLEGSFGMDLGAMGSSLGSLSSAAKLGITGAGMLAAGGGSGGGGGGGATGAYTDAATAQGTASRDAANFNTNINRADQVGPGGSLTWSQDPATGRWTQTSALDSTNQGIFDAKQQTGQNFGNAAQTASAGLAGAYGSPMSTANLPGLQTVSGGNLSPTQMQAAQMQAARAEAAQSTYDSTIRDKFDTSGVRGLPGQVDDTSRQRVEQALMSRLNPQYANDERALRSRLLNSGIEVGTEAYNQEMNNLGQRLNDARMQAVLAGGQEENRQVGLTQGLQAQEFGQAQAQGQFGQTADTQTAGNKLQNALANAGFQQQTNMGNAGWQQQASLTNATFQQQANAANQAAANLAAQQSFQNQLASANQNNAARGQGFGENVALRNQPLAEALALQQGTQMQTPNFGSYYTGGAAQTAPVLDATIAQGNFNLGQATQDQSGKNALLGGLTQLGAAWLGS